MRIDIQSHVFPTPYMEYFKDHPGNVSVMKKGENYLMNFSGAQILGIDAVQQDAKALLQSMDESGIDISLISYPLPDPYMFDAGCAVQACRIANDCIADVVGRYPQRFFGLAFLPWADTDEALEELVRAKSMGFKGVVLFPNCGDIDVDDDRIFPVYEACAQAAMPVVLHPTIPKWAGAIGAYAMPATMGFVIDTGFALYRLIKSGVVKKLPELKIIIPHAGGVLPYLDGRIDYIPPSQRPDGKAWSHIPEILKHGSIWYDAANPSPAVLEYLLKYVSADKVMFATDYPYVEASVMVQMLERMNLDHETMEKINWKNANNVFGLNLQAG